MNKDSSEQILSSLDTFLELSLSCKPTDIFGFAERFFLDEKEADNEVAHAVHTLPFLLYSPDQFRNTACTIFCSYMKTDSISKDELDAGVLMKIIDRMNLGNYWMPVLSIDEVTRAYIELLKVSDFNTFISAMRLPVACYQLIFWLKYEVAEYCKTIMDNKLLSTTPEQGIGKNNILTFQDLMLPSASINVVKFRNHVQSRVSSSSSASAVTSPLLIIGNSAVTQHDHLLQQGEMQWSVSDRRIWTKLLCTTVEDILADSRSSHLSQGGSCCVEELVNECAKKYVSLAISPSGLQIASAIAGSTFAITARTSSADGGI